MCLVCVVWILHRRQILKEIAEYQLNVLNAAEKAKILEAFLSNYNDGRKKTFFYAAVNLLELQDLQTALREFEHKPIWKH